MADPSIIVVGSINRDVVIQASHFPLAGETILGSTLQQFTGGKGANQAVAAHRAGADVTFVGCVGDDDIGHLLLADLSASGLRRDHVRQIASSASGVAVVILTDAGENRIIVIPGANARMTVQDSSAAQARLQAAQLVVAQLEIPLDVVLATFRQARAGGVMTLLNPSPARSLDQATLQLVDIIVCNETEAEQLTRHHLATSTEMQSAAQMLHYAGPQLVVITLGSQGVFVSDRMMMTVLPAFTVPVVDTTAAGDAFLGAFACEIALGSPPLAAARVGAAAGAITVMRRGAQVALPTRAEIMTFLAQNRPQLPDSLET